ncbi:MAG: T9SS type A sorting domain-containing protein [Saprospiraceae bacterium]|nr:T9SS type A sorting domain-containing protein [Saprospiraceae bacterium]
MRTCKLIAHRTRALILIVLVALVSTSAQSDRNAAWTFQKRVTYHDLDGRQLVASPADDDPLIEGMIQAWLENSSSNDQTAVFDALEELPDPSSNVRLREVMAVLWKHFLADKDVPPIQARASCPAGDVILTTQDEVNAFGALGCTVITGDLIISDFFSDQAICDLSPLSSLTSVDGQLRIITDCIVSVDGLSNLTTIGANLDIALCSSLQNIDGLSGLTSLGGSLYLFGNTSLQNLDGLSTLASAGGLTHVNGSVRILSCPLLTDAHLGVLANLSSVLYTLNLSNLPLVANLNWLSNLSQIGNSLYIQGLPLLSDLNGLANVGSVDYFIIRNNNALQNLDGLSQLTTADGPRTPPCGCFAIWNRIENNPSLENLDGLSGLTTIEGNFIIANNASLQNTDGLSNLSWVGGDWFIHSNNALTEVGAADLLAVGGALVIENNASLASVSGFSNLHDVHDDLVIRGNPSLVNLNGLHNVSSVGIWMIIDNNDALVNLEGLNGLASIGSRFQVVNNDKLKNLEGMTSLTHVGEIIWVENNSVIKNLEGLSSLSSAGGVRVLFNPLIKNINGIEGLTSLGSGGLDLFSNASLKDVSAMSNINWIGGDLIFQELPSLVNIDAASNVTYVGGTCGIASCPLVTNVDGFSNITYVGHDGGAFDMAALEDLDGFSNVTWMGGSLFVFDNPSLTSCCGIYQLLCADDPACTSDNVGGGIYIFNNPSACSSSAEIIASGPCAPTGALPQSSGPIPTTAYGSDDIAMYPNPAADRVNIDLNQKPEGPLHIRILNSLGHEVWAYEVPAHQRKIVYHIADQIVNGLYHVHFAYADHIVAKPLIIMR